MGEGVGCLPKRSWEGQRAVQGSLPHTGLAAHTATAKPRQEPRAPWPPVTPHSCWLQSAETSKESWERLCRSHAALNPLMYLSEQQDTCPRVLSNSDEFSRCLFESDALRVSARFDRKPLSFHFKVYFRMKAILPKKQELLTQPGRNGGFKNN